VNKLLSIVFPYQLKSQQQLKLFKTQSTGNFQNFFPQSYAQFSVITGYSKKFIT